MKFVATVKKCSYYVEFDGGFAVLRRGIPDNVLDIVYFEVASTHRNAGIARTALQWITSYFGKLLRPVDVLPQSAGFWRKMSLEGLVLFNDWRE